ncbi:hypothetical protein ACFY94_26025 [Streptomyces griseorubiginosus]
MTRPSGVTARRLLDWTADVWPHPHDVLPDELRTVGLLDRAML